LITRPSSASWRPLVDSLRLDATDCSVHANHLNDTLGLSTTSVTGHGGIRLNVHLAGPPDGVPVLLLHGQASSGRIWHRLMSGPLARSARLVAPDNRGHGQSEKPLHGYGDGRTWAEDSSAVVDQLALDRPVLVGWSCGTAVACDYLRHGGRARAFALVSGGTEADSTLARYVAALYDALYWRHA
jgi:pimeloyl-ACP methyl ester carboxylesterase